MGKINEPYYIDNQLVRMTKGYTTKMTDVKSLYTSDLFAYISHYYDEKHKALKYDDGRKEHSKYGAADQYDCRFYLKQAALHYEAAKKSPIEVAMLPAYYCMLNLAKSYLSFKSENVNQFVVDFMHHGIGEDHSAGGNNDLSGITIKYRTPNPSSGGNGGVFPLLAKTLDNDFSTKWNPADGKSLKTLLYNLPFVQSSFMKTYATSHNKIPELFIPLAQGTAPYYFYTDKTKVILKADIDEGYLRGNGGKLSSQIIGGLTSKLNYDGEKHVISKDSVFNNRNNGKSTDFQNFNLELRKYFVYNGGNHPMWFIKKTELSKTNADVLNISTITINMAIMHRLSEIARYKPEQLNKLLNSHESWLIREYMDAALDQFVDEMASEITGHYVEYCKW